MGEGFVPAPETGALAAEEGDHDQSNRLPEQALPPNQQTGNEDDGTDWLWILFIVALTGGVAWATVMLSRRLGRECFRRRLAMFSRSAGAMKKQSRLRASSPPDWRWACSPR